MLCETVFMEWRDSTMLSRFRRPALSALLALALPLTSAWAAAPAPLKVMSFNVRTPADTEPGKRWPDRRDAMVKVILDAHPAVIGTQELVQEQADYLAGHLPGYRWFGEGRRGGSGDEHMGVFYDSNVLAIEQSGNFWLSDTPDVPGSITWGNLYPRMVTWALFRRIDDGRRFYFMNTHLPYRDEDEPRRVKGAELIGTRVAKLPADLPVVLTGDFNSEPGGDTYKAFTRVLQDTRTQVKAPQGPRLTFHDFTGKATVQLDWVLVRGFHARSFLTDDRRVDGVLPSDHFPLWRALNRPRQGAATPPAVTAVAAATAGDTAPDAGRAPGRCGRRSPETRPHRSGPARASNPAGAGNRPQRPSSPAPAAPRPPPTTRHRVGPDRRTTSVGYPAIRPPLLVLPGA